MQRVQSGRNVGGGGWTLVELLVVLAVIAILSALSFPALKGMIQGPARKAAISEITGILEQARAAAVTMGEPTAFVIADGNAGTKDHLEAFRSYAVFQLLRLEDPGGAAAAWQATAPLTDWRKLPQGTAFASEANGGFSKPTLLDLREDSFVDQVRLPGSGSGSLPGVVFNRFGAIEIPPAGEDALRLAIVEGFTEGNRLHLTNKNLKNADVADVILLSRYTGRTRVLHR